MGRHPRHVVWKPLVPPPLEFTPSSLICCLVHWQLPAKGTTARHRQAVPIAAHGRSGAWHQGFTSAQWTELSTAAIAPLGLMVIPAATQRRGPSHDNTNHRHLRHPRTKVEACHRQRCTAGSCPTRCTSMHSCSRERLCCERSRATGETGWAGEADWVGTCWRRSSGGYSLCRPDGSGHRCLALRTAVPSACVLRENSPWLRRCASGAVFVFVYVFFLVRVTAGKATGYETLTHERYCQTAFPSFPIRWTGRARCVQIQKAI